MPRAALTHARKHARHFRVAVITVVGLLALELAHAAARRSPSARERAFFGSVSQIPSASPPSYVSYDGSAAMLMNPERGFRWELDDFPSTAGLSDALALNVTLAQCYAYLPASRSTPLNASFLAALDGGFAALRAAGVKAVLRFAYDRLQPGENDYDFGVIARDQASLAPIVAANADVIYVLEAGFVGSWGEWHSSRNGLEKNETGLAALVANKLYGGIGLPLTTFVMLRYAGLKSAVLRPVPPLSEAQQAAWPGMVFGVVDGGSVGSQAAYARLGYHNDGFLSTASDGDTYFASLPADACGEGALPIVPLMCSLDGPIVDAGFAVTTAEAPYLPIGGEMYWNAGADNATTLVVDGHTAAHRLRMQRFSYLSIVHGLAPYGSGGSAGGGGSRSGDCESGGDSESDHRAGRSRGGEYDRAKGRRIENSDYRAKGRRLNGIENINAWMREPLNISRLWNCGGPSWFDCGMPAPDAYVQALPNLTAYDYIRDFLGYRVQLLEASFPASVALGAELTVAVRLVNYGFAAPANPRGMLLALIDAGAAGGAGAIVFTAPFPGVDARAWQPFVPNDPLLQPLVHFAGAAPRLAALAPGAYALGLYLPDAAPGASNASAFSVRLANKACATMSAAGVNACTWWWVDARSAGGVNVIGQVVVSAAAATE